MHLHILHIIPRLLSATLVSVLLTVTLPPPAVVAVIDDPAEIWVNGDWTSQGDVDAYDATLTWQDDAFATIQDGVDAAAEYEVVNVLWFDGQYGAFNVATDGVSVVGHARPDDVDELPVVGGVGMAHPDIVHMNGVATGVYLAAVLSADGVLLSSLEVRSDDLISDDAAVFCNDSRGTLLQGLAIVGDGTQCSAVGLWVRNGSVVTLTGSALTGNFMGIHAWDTSELTVTDSTIAESTHIGVRIRQSAVVTVTDSEINDNGWNGIKLSESASISLTGTDVIGNAWYGIGAVGASRWASGYATVDVNDCRINGNGGGWVEDRGAGISVRAGVTLDVVDSEINDNVRDGINAKTENSYGNQGIAIRVSDTTIGGNGRDGVTLHLWDESGASGCPDAGSSVCKGNEHAAPMRTQDLPEPAFRAAYEPREGEVPIGGNALISNCAITNNGRSGIHDANEGSVALFGCTLSGNENGAKMCTDFEGSFEAVDNNFEGNTAFGVVNASEGAGYTVDCRNNWWGDASGPYHETLNVDGLGDNVSGDVQYEPWLGAAVVAAGADEVTDDNVDAVEQAEVEVQVVGTAQVYAASLESNPGGDTPAELTALGKYVDVYVPDTAGATELELRVYYTQDELDAAGVIENFLVLYWWDGLEWVACSESGVSVGPFGSYRGYVWATVNEGTTPSLADLGGTPFVVLEEPGDPPPAANTVGGEAYAANTLALMAPWLVALAAIVAVGALVRRFVRS